MFNFALIIRALIMILCWANASIVAAHTLGISQGEYQFRIDHNKPTVQMALAFSRNELMDYLSLSSSVISPNIHEHQDAIQKFIVDLIEVKTKSTQCSGKLISSTDNQNENNRRDDDLDGVYLNLNYTCSNFSGIAMVNLAFLGSLVRGHRHLVSIMTDQGGAMKEVAYQSKSSFEIPLTTMPENQTDFAHSLNLMTADESNDENFSSMVTFGLEHILLGFDHLLFIFGLILIAGSAGSLIFAITAFTLAHSITISLSILHIWTPNTSWVEPFIALTIIYVSIENLIAKNTNSRWIITFIFGLIHGFGFAGALMDISLPEDQLIKGLVGFNLGVEIGQLAAIAVALPILMVLHKIKWFSSTGIFTLNISLMIVGGYWFLERSNSLALIGIHI